MNLVEITNIIESAAPLKWQEAWDNSGLQVGSGDADIKAVLLSVDVTEAVVREAIERGCNLLVSHHPLLFHGLKHLTGQTSAERCVAMAVKNDLAIYSTHTPIDSYLHGVSGRMAEKCGLTDYRILCNAPLSAADDDHGLGVIGTLAEPMLFTQWLLRVKDSFQAPVLRYVQPPKEEIRTIALCGGAGGSMIEEAIAQQADVYVTADMRYHDMQAADGRIGVVDMDHWVSEHYVRDVLQEMLTPYVKVYISRSDHSPVQVI